MLRSKVFITISSLLAFLAIVSCEKQKSNSRSMEEIREQEGVPVSIEEIQTKPFEKKISYFATLEGIKEMTKGAPIGGKIEKINYSVGSTVKEDDIIIEFPTDSPGMQYEQAKLGHENSKKTYERLKALYETGDASKQDLDNIETKYKVDKENFENVKQMLFIDAPFNGIITKLYVDEADNVKGKAPLFTIAQLNKVKAKIWVPEKEINLIHKGMRAFAKVNGKDYLGSITEISLSAEPMRQAFYAEIEFTNSNRELKSGTTVDIEIVTYSNENAIKVQRNLVKKDATGHYVYIENGGKASKKYIETGHESGMELEIKNGLSAGDRLIIKGLTMLSDNAKVKVVQ